MVTTAHKLDKFVSERLSDTFSWGERDCWSVWYIEWCQGVLGIGRDPKFPATFTDARSALKDLKKNKARSLPHLISMLLKGYEISSEQVLLGDLCVVETDKFEGGLKVGLGAVMANGFILVLAPKGFTQIERDPTWKCYGSRR